MKKFISLFIWSIFLVGCGTSENAIQTAIAHTETANKEVNQVTQPDFNDDAEKIAEDNKNTAETRSITPSDTPEPTSTNTPKPTNTATPNPTPTIPPVGLSRSAPIGIDEVGVVPSWDVSIINIMRSNDAWQAIQSANMFNDEPPMGYEYILAFVHIKSTHGDGAEHEINERDFSITGDKAIKYDQPFVVSPAPSLEANLFDGGQFEGWVSLQVSQDENNLLLIFEPPERGSRPYFFALQEGAAIGIDQQLQNLVPNEFGLERSSPAPPDATIITENWHVQVIEYKRGDSALLDVEAANMFNDKPDSGFEYVIVKVAVKYISPIFTDSTVRISNNDFGLTGDEGVLYDNAFAVAPFPELDAEFYPGGEFVGWIVFQAKENESGLTLVFDSPDSDRRFFALDEK